MSFVELSTDLVASLGYWGIGLLAAVELFFPPIPSEVILPFAGFTAQQGKLSLTGVIVAGTIGTMVASSAIYYLGRLVSQDSLDRWIAKHGRKIGVTSGDWDKAQAWFDRNGYRSVFLGRFLPGIRSVVSLPAGVRRLGFTRFFLLSAIGATIWNAGLAIAGFALGDQFTQVENVVGLLTTVVLILLGALIGWFAYRAWRLRAR